MSIEQSVLPLISPCLSQEESVIQSLTILEKFQHDFRGFIQNIHQQIDVRKQRLSTIRARISTVRQKIKNVNNSNKAIRTYAPSNFPRTEKIPRNDLFICPNRTKSIKFNYKLSNESAAICSTKASKKLPASFDLCFQSSETTQDLRGIGDPPANLISTGNLLIYNTNINAYKNYSMIDPLNIAPLTRPQEKKQEPAKAPETVALGHQFDALQRLNFDYNPILGDVPQIEVPDSLPELLGIVTDLKYFADANETGIAPSIILTDVTVDLPDFDSEVILADPIVTSPPPIPKSLSNDLQITKIEDSVKKDEDLPPKVVIPPIKAVEVNETPKIVPPEASQMKSLLDSILNAGGKDQFKFKSKNKERERPKAKEPEEKMDIMSQLKKVLTRRGDSLRGKGDLPPEPPRSKKYEDSPFIKSISKIIKNESMDEDENEEGWTD